jgi:Peptidase propeptide and YPEB domain
MVRAAAVRHRAKAQQADWSIFTEPFVSAARAQDIEWQKGSEERDQTRFLGHEAGNAKEDMNMWTRPICQAALWLAIMAIVSPASALTQDELVAKIQAAGYSQVSDIKSTAEGITATAKKDGKEVRLVVDSSGQIKEQK